MCLPLLPYTAKAEAVPRVGGQFRQHVIGEVRDTAAEGRAGLPRGERSAHEFAFVPRRVYAEVGNHVSCPPVGATSELGV